MKLYVADRETWTFIEEVCSIKEGLELIKKYEESDKEEGVFEENFYDIVDEERSESFIDMTDFGLFVMEKGLKMMEISKEFEIPYRTVQDWKNGNGKCPVYVLNMLKTIYEGRG